MVAAPRERVNAGFGGRFGQQSGGYFEVVDLRGIIVEPQGVEAANATGAHAAGGRIKAQDGFGRYVVGKQGFDAVARDGGGAPNLAGCGSARDVGDDEKGRAGQRVSDLEAGLPPIGEAKPAWPAGGLGDPIREGAGEVLAGVLGLAGVAASQLGPAVGEGTGVIGALGAIGAEAIQPMAEVDALAAKAAFTQ